MAHPTRLLLTLTLGLSLVSACGERSRLPAQQDGSTQDGFTPTDGGGPKKKDACVRPANGCFSSNDCKPGYTCVGCGADPCCPMCAVCYGTCQPKPPGACSSTKDCLEGSYCHFDSGCGTSAGQCKPRPSGCYTIYKPVCGCDDKTYSNDCMAWSNGVSVAYLGACKKPTCSAKGGVCTSERWILCPVGFEPIHPSPHQDCGSGWCCVKAPTSTCSAKAGVNCVWGSACTGCWGPATDKTLTCESGRVCCQDICD